MKISHLDDLTALDWQFGVSQVILLQIFANLQCSFDGQQTILKLIAAFNRG